MDRTVDYDQRHHGREFTRQTHHGEYQTHPVEATKPMSKQKYSLQTLKRGLEALVLLNEFNYLSVNQLGEKLKVARTNARRLLDTLVTLGYARKVPDGSGYYLLPQTTMLSAGVTDETFAVDAAASVLFEKSSQIGWPLALYTREDDHVVLRLTTDKAFPLAAQHYPLGATFPLAKSTAGKTFLIFAPSSKRVLNSEEARTAAASEQRLARDPTFVLGLIEAWKDKGYIQEPGLDGKVRAVGRDSRSRENSGTVPGGAGVPVMIGGQMCASLVVQLRPNMIPDGVVREKYVPFLKKISAEITAAAETTKMAVNKKRPTTQHRSGD